ncbi:MAG: hypothetical protein WDZ31_07375 [Phycisphaeraceae bacterium]
MTRAEVDRQWRVRVGVDVALPVSAAWAWRRMQHLAWFATLDPFHERIHLREKPARPGTPLAIEHRYAGMGLTRVGRILQWREGESYSFSDLSRRGRQAGFPHVYVYTVQPRGEAACCVSVTVRGRWTLRVLPRWLVRAWLWWVMMQTGQRIRHALLAEAVAGEWRIK